MCKTLRNFGACLLTVLCTKHFSSMNVDASRCG